MKGRCFSDFALNDAMNIDSIPFDNVIPAAQGRICVFFSPCVLRLETTGTTGKNNLERGARANSPANPVIEYAFKGLRGGMRNGTIMAFVSHIAHACVCATMAYGFNTRREGL